MSVFLHSWKGCEIFPVGDGINLNTKFGKETKPFQRTADLDRWEFSNPIEVAFQNPLQINRRM